MFPFPAHPNTLDEYSTHLYWGFCAEDRARPDERNIYLWKASPNVGHKSSKQIKWDARPNVFHICENNKVESGRKVYVSSPRTILPKVLSFNPPQIKPSTDSSSICEYAALTERVAKPLTAPRGLARNTARRDEQEFPPTVLLRAWGTFRGTRTCHRTAPLGARARASPAASSGPKLRSQAGSFFPGNSQSVPPPWIAAWENLCITSLAMRKTLGSLPPLVSVTESLSKRLLEELVKPRESAHLS